MRYYNLMQTMMASVGQCSLASKLDDITECPICSERFTDPISLPCIHTYCSKCINSYCSDKQPGDQMPCPVCRRKFSIPEGGLSVLPRNFFMEKLVGMLERQKGNHPTHIYNILLLGETGVGKSTWINGLLNYLTYTSLSEAENGKAIWLTPSHFPVFDENYEVRVISYGEDSNEVHNEGQSTTQMPQTYRFQMEDVELRIIDTPGICDTRGVEHDMINLQNTMTHLSNYDEIHGIVILMKPNNARLNVLFQFCVKEVLTHLHRDACKNIVICFTNARSTFYKPGDSFLALKELLHENTDVNIALNKNTVYCMDNESIRFLMAIKNQIYFTPAERKEFNTSWMKSVDESFRLISYIAGLDPHSIKHTTSLLTCRVRRSIIALSRPIAEFTKTIQDNINLLKDKQEEELTEHMTTEQLSKKLYVPTMDLIAIELGYPKTVCAASTCISVVEVGDNEKKEYKKEFKTVCHEKCQIITDKDIVNNPELQRCWAMKLSNGATCRVCGCEWFAHMHITYETKQVSTNIVDENIQMLFSAKMSVLEAVRQHKKQLEEVIEELETEKKHMVKVCARLACFIRRNAIYPVNDAIGDYMDHLIDIERGKHNAGGNRTALQNLMNLKESYLQEMRLIEEAREHKDTNDQQLDADTILKDIAGLYKLKTAGSKLEKIMTVVDKSHDNAVMLAEKVVVVNKPSRLSALSDAVKKL